MSDDANISVNDGMSAIADSVDQAVSSNSQENTDQNDQPLTDAYGNPTGAQPKQRQVAQAAKEIIKDPNASKAQKVEAKKMLKKLTLKVDGQEFEEDLPFEIPDDPKAIEYMRRELQMGKMGQKRAQEKAAIEKDVIQFLEDLKKNPRKALSDPAIGMDLKKFAAEIIEQEIEDSKKSPSQLEKEKLEAEIKELKESRDKEKKDFEEKELERLREVEFERYDTLMTQALEKHKIPKNPAVIRRMADYMLIGLEAGKDVAPEDIVPLIREDLKSDYKTILESLSEDDLEEFIGKDILNRVRKKTVAKAKQANSNPAVKGQQKVAQTGQAKVEEKPIEKKTLKQMFGV